MKDDDPGGLESALDGKFFSAARKVLGFDEGVRTRPYKDSLGYWTVGIGHLIGERLEDLKFSEQVIEAIFREDLKKAIVEAETLFGVEFMATLDRPRKLAIVSLLFTLGLDKLSKFTQTVPAIRQRNWELASKLLLKTKWAWDVDPLRRPGKGRDDRVAHMLTRGEIHPEYRVDITG